MGKFTVQEISKLGVHVALMLALSLIPYTGYLDIGPLSITILPVFVSIATWHMGWKGAIATSLAFGMGSYFKALYTPGLMIFVNYPELAIVPRFLIGIALGAVVMAMKDIKLWKVAITSALAVVFNTAFVTAWYFLLKEYRDASEVATLKAWLILIYINFIAEFFIGTAIGIATYKVVLHLRKDMADRKAVSY